MAFVCFCFVCFKSMINWKPFQQLVASVFGPCLFWALLVKIFSKSFWRSIFFFSTEAEKNAFKILAASSCILSLILMLPASPPIHTKFHWSDCFPSYLFLYILSQLPNTVLKYAALRNTWASRFLSELSAQIGIWSLLIHTVFCSWVQHSRKVLHLIIRKLKMLRNVLFMLNKRFSGKNMMPVLQVSVKNFKHHRKLNTGVNIYK